MANDFFVKNDSNLRGAIDGLLAELEKEQPHHIENIAVTCAAFIQGYASGLVRMNEKILQRLENERRAQDLDVDSTDYEPEKGSPELDPIDQFDKMWVPNKGSKIAHLVQLEVQGIEDYPHAAYSLCGYKLVRPRYAAASPEHKNQPVISVKEPSGWYICKNCEKVANAI